jgi:uncharacterized surface protein with fasciclin (FAS1) repeats
MSSTRLLLAAAAAILCTASAATAQTPAPAPAAATAAPAAGSATPVAVNGDTLSTLKMSGQFTTFVKAVDSTNLAALLKTPNITVFAPNDAAFAAMPAADLQKLMADKAGLQRFVIHHVINAQVPAEKIKGTKGEWPSVAGDKILLDGSEEATLKADGARIIQADLKTVTGWLHIVDKPLIAGAGGSPALPAQPAPADASATAPAKP